MNPRYPELVDSNREVITEPHIAPTDKNLISLKTQLGGEMAEHDFYEAINQAVFENKHHMLVFSGLQVKL